MRSRWFLVAALILALAGSMCLYIYLRQLDRRVAVVVAAREISRHELLSNADVRLAYVHPSALLPGASRTVAEVAGRWAVREIMTGEQVTAARLDAGASSATAFGLGLAFRALFVPCGYARAAGGAIWEGDRVDVIAVTTGLSDPVAYRVAQDLEVLEVRDDQGMRVQRYGDADGLGGVLVAVPDALAESLALAISCGHVYLALRDPAATSFQATGQ
jgi:pilus assembly protein CpaB